MAAGGGGDAVGAMMLHAALEPAAEGAVIAAFAWDRLLVDPVPGPRGPGSFLGLRRLGERTFVVTSRTHPRAPVGSTLPRLAARLPATLLLLDPYGGGRGVAEQLREAIRLFTVGRVVIADVGGDVTARGDEDGLRSPFADALSLAACGDLPVPVEVVVAGAGLDGELPAARVHDRIRAAGGAAAASLRPEHAAVVMDVFDWHPAEAASLLVAAICGARGVVEFRDSAGHVTLDEDCARLWRCPHEPLASASLLAPKLVETRTLADVEQVLRDVCGRSEIDEERAKADRIAELAGAPVPIHAVHERLADFEAAARARGADFVTFRRLTDALGSPPGGYLRLRADLIRRRPQRYVRPLWRLYDAPVAPAAAAT